MNSKRWVNNDEYIIDVNSIHRLGHTYLLTLLLRSHILMNHAVHYCYYHKLCYYIQRSLKTGAADFDKVVETPSFPG